MGGCRNLNREVEYNVDIKSGGLPSSTAVLKGN